MSDLQLQPAAATSLQRWHAMVAEADLSALPELLAPSVVFRSPMAHSAAGFSSASSRPWLISGWYGV